MRPINPSDDFITAVELRKMVSYNHHTGDFKWIPPFGSKKNSNFGSLSRGYKRVVIKGKRIAAHRLAWFYYYGIWPKGLLDHINGDSRDNRIVNLREADFTKNQFNRRTKNKTGFRGVVKSTTCDRYEAHIRINGKTTYLGRFVSKEEAALAYQAASEKFHGPFAFHTSRTE